MVFEQPIWLIFLFLLAVPVLIHLFQRNRAKVQVFSAYEFLLIALKKVARRNKLRKILLLVVRCLIILLMVTAFARPYLKLRAQNALYSGPLPSATLFIIDASYSLQYKEAGETLLDRGKTIVKAAIEAFSQKDQGAILLASDSIQIIEGFTSDRYRLKKRLLELAPTFKGSDLPRAISVGVSLFKAVSAPVKQIVLVSDMAAHAFQNTLMKDVLRDLPADIQLIPINVRGEKALDNRAVVGIRLERDFSNPKNLKVLVRLANYSDRLVKDLPVSLWLRNKGQTSAWKGNVSIGPRGEAEKVFSLADPGGEPYEITAAIPADPLPVDNQSYFVYAPGSATKVLAINGDYRDHPYLDELFYLNRAMKAIREREAPIELKAIEAGEVDSVDLKKYQVVMLCNVKSLPEQFVKRLISYVKEGGGLFISLGNQIDPDFYHSALAEVLPVEILAQRTHPLTEKMGIQEKGFYQSRKSKASPASPEIETRLRRYYFIREKEPYSALPILTLANGERFLSSYPVGQGKVLLLTSTIDRDWNDLPVRSTFIPLMYSAIAYLKGADRGLAANLKVGEPIQIQFQRLSESPAWAKGSDPFYIQPPQAGKIRLSPEFAGKKGALTYEKTELPGLYPVFKAGQPFFIAAVNVAAEKEGDLKQTSWKMERKNQMTASSEAARPLKKVQLFSTLMLLIPLLLLFQALLEYRR